MRTNKHGLRSPVAQLSPVAATICVGDVGGDMAASQTYKGYQIFDMSVLVGAGIYRARVAVVPESSTSTRNQRFLDFETFTSIDAARLRAIDGAVSWIDNELARARLDMRTRFS